MDIFSWHLTTFAHMKHFTIFVGLLLATLAVSAQEPDTTILEELPAKPAPAKAVRQAPPGYAYNDYNYLITAQQAYWSKLGSYYTDKYYQNGKTGMKANDGTVLLPAEYDDLHFQYCGFMVASKAGRFGVINEANEVVIPFSYKRLELLYKPLAFQVPKGVPLEDLRLLATREDGQSGLINGKGETVFPFRENRFVHAHYFYPAARSSQGYVSSDPPAYPAAMRQTVLIYHQPGERGVVGMDGQIVLPFEYAAIEISYGNQESDSQNPEWVQAVKADGKAGLFDLRLRRWLIEPKFYGGIGALQNLNPGEKPFYPTLFATQTETEPDEAGVTYIRSGLIDSTGKTVLPFEYDGFDKHFLHDGKLNFWTQKGKWGVVDIDNKVVVPFEHAKPIQKFVLNGRPHFSLKDPSDQFFGMLSMDDQMVIPFQYKWLGDHNGRLVIFVNEEMKCGLIDAKGTVALPATYTDIQLLRHGYFYINSESRLGIVDPSGKVVVQPAYRGAYKENMLPALSGAFKAKGIPEAEVVTVLTKEDGASFAFLRSGKIVNLD